MVGEELSHLRLAPEVLEVAEAAPVGIRQFLAITYAREDILGEGVLLPHEMNVIGEDDGDSKFVADGEESLVEVEFLDETARLGH